MVVSLGDVRCSWQSTILCLSVKSLICYVSKTLLYERMNQFTFSNFIEC